MMVFNDFIWFWDGCQTTYWVRTEYVQKQNPYKGRKSPEKGRKNPNGRTYSMRILMNFGDFNFTHFSKDIYMFQLVFWPPVPILALLLDTFSRQRCILHRPLRFQLLDRQWEKRFRWNQSRVAVRSWKRATRSSSLARRKVKNQVNFKSGSRSEYIILVNYMTFVTLWVLSQHIAIIHVQWE